MRFKTEEEYVARMRIQYKNDTAYLRRNSVDPDKWDNIDKRTVEERTDNPTEMCGW